MIYVGADAHVRPAELCSAAKRTILRRKNGIHGKYKEANQGRTQESKTHGAQESESRKAVKAAGVRPWIEEAQSEEDGARRGEAVKRRRLAFSTWRLAFKDQMLSANC
jgi:hypothetical protein